MLVAIWKDENGTQSKVKLNGSKMTKNLNRNLAK